MEELIAEIARELDAFKQHETGTNVLRELRPMFDRLGQEQRFADLLDALYDEGRALAAMLVAAEADFVERARTLAARIPEESYDAPNQDPAPGVPPKTLAHVRGIIGKPTEITDVIPHLDFADPSCVKNLDLTLQVRMNHMTEQQADLRRELLDELREIKSDYDARFIALSPTLRSSPGLAALRLNYLRNQLILPNTYRTATLAADHEVRRDVYGEFAEIYRLMHEDPQLGQGHRGNHVEIRLVSAVRADVERVFVEIMRRARKAPTRLALLRRYKTRCEWYTRDEMRRLGEAADAVARPEDRIVEDLSRFLFEEGLNTLNTPMTGRVRADILDTSQPRFTLYIEAKQYEDRDGATTALRAGLRQVASTANILDPLSITEAFLVIFRRRGPLLTYSHPSAKVGNVIVHVLTIDIAPWDEVGSAEGRNPFEVDPRTYVDTSTRA